MDKWLQQMSVSKKLNFIILIASIILSFGTVFFMVAASTANNEFIAFEEKSFEGVKTVLETEKELNYFSRVTREIMLGGDLNENLAKLDQSYSKIEKLLNTLEKNSNDQHQRNLLKQAKHDAISFLNSSRSLMKSIKPNQTNLHDMYLYYHQNFSPLAKASRDSMQKLVGVKMDESEEMKKNFKEEIFTFKIIAVIGSILALMGMWIITSLIAAQIKNALTKTQTSLLSFFRFLNHETTQIEIIDFKSKDEFGQMIALMNKNMLALSRTFTNDQQAIKMIEEVTEQTALGFVSVRLHTETGSSEVKKAVDAINRMLESLEEALNTSSAILASYARANYTANVEIGRYSGEIGGMLMALKALGESSGDFMALVGRNGNALNGGAETLSMASENLSTAANQQASSLEETAAAIEELTSNISANSQKASEMATLARETENAANSGKTLADSTVVSMNEISKATQAINEAVNIIENIAFQTNILSLNAAVEAATAGEAGKGFAVVAQEVRNLANRSADAASQIKELAELANSKSQDGLRVSEEMMKGFDVINQKITQTTQLVQDVANGSREQMAGINQINTAVTQLDQMTQQNAQSANEVNSLSSNILHMAKSLQDTASKTTYYPESENRICRVDMMFDTTKLKLDHVLFKNNNFAKLKEQRVTAWTVTNETQCDLGKWIQVHSHENYAQGSAWNELLSHHAHVHQKVQEFVTIKASGKMSNDVRKRLSLEIEQDTAKVFDALNKVRAEACRHEPVKEVAKKPKKVPMQSQHTNSIASAAKKPTVPTSTSKHDDNVWESF
ncbi:MAG: hypothetical protein CJD30_03725 [Sulfuricurvum sp. PD_MW2]|jgi:methyl-accepting chemotaxis protein|uniref:methyl-accepting chemotaxis protein n=1 Tax=Sulfuricurvum sp. PD_MW2 TaxID=2027917 RepID=UPI000C067888|nr:methyl-accepting chemotaxis protein [Sulfuricurvum sp. PD_MW2]PHM17880.1 MAG: hypothetical protein CJD30_03725 [Sulfuricurvum sp. PD_MW2]